VQIADIGGGAMMGVIGILSAVIAREQTGHGQYVDIGMLDGSVAWNVYHLLLYQLSGQLPGRGREQISGHHACYNVYETRDGRYVTVGAYEGHFWATLCRHFGREDFVPWQWDTGDKRTEMLAFFRAAFREKTLAQWMAELGDQEICFGPVSTLDEMVRDPQVVHRQMIVDIDTPAGPMRATGTPIKLSDTPASIRTPPPVYGEHTAAVLAGLGLTADEIATLRARAVV
jgi:crotonobetainyl-CoA:carnitine CoA-transferase CaiB-like acyl-CoA transferase